jgi:hypothetical protein
LKGNNLGFISTILDYKLEKIKWAWLKK